MTQSEKPVWPYRDMLSTASSALPYSRPLHSHVGERTGDRVWQQVVGRRWKSRYCWRLAILVQCQVVMIKIKIILISWQCPGTDRVVYAVHAFRFHPRSLKLTLVLDNSVAVLCRASNASWELSTQLVLATWVVVAPGLMSSFESAFLGFLLSFAHTTDI